MSSTTNQDLASIFDQMGLIYEMQEDTFRQRAYQRGALVLAHLAESVSDLYKSGGLKALNDIPGIGEGMAKKIEEYIKTRHVREYEKLKKSIPVNLEELTSVEGVGPKKVKVLYQKLKIKNLNDLEKAARAGKIRKLRGFGEKTEKNILQGISFTKESGERMRLGDVLPYARELVEAIRGLSGVHDVSEGGSLRRRQETIGDVDILVAVEDGERNRNTAVKKIFDYIEKLPQVAKAWGRGKTKLSVHLRSASTRGYSGTKQGFDIDVRIVPKESWGAALQYFTGDKDHNVKLRQIAIAKGYKLNEYGLFKGNLNVAKGKDEAFIYQKLGLTWMEPELRTNAGELEAALRQTNGKPSGLPKLIGYDAIRGDNQVQTNWTDGLNTIEEMAHAAQKLGLEYITITDHTKHLAMTGGLNEKQLLQQKKEIERLNKKIKGMRILSGVECDILKDGSLDIDDEVLAQLDVVGVSVHSYFNLPQKEQTERVIRAIQNPNVDIFFHPTARRIGKRAPINLAMEEIIRIAKATGTVLEINAHPERLDLRDEYIHMAIRAGVKLCINTDAHSVDGFQVLEYGIAQARRGWATKKDIINTLAVDKFLKALKDGRF